MNVFQKIFVVCIGLTAIACASEKNRFVPVIPVSKHLSFHFNDKSQELTEYLETFQPVCTICEEWGSGKFWFGPSETEPFAHKECATLLKPFEAEFDAYATHSDMPKGTALHALAHARTTRAVLNAVWPRTINLKELAEQNPALLQKLFRSRGKTEIDELKATVSDKQIPENSLFSLIKDCPAKAKRSVALFAAMQIREKETEERKDVTPCCTPEEKTVNIVKISGKTPHELAMQTALLFDLQRAYMTRQDNGTSTKQKTALQNLEERLEKERRERTKVNKAPISFEQKTAQPEPTAVEEYPLINALFNSEEWDNAINQYRCVQSHLEPEL